MGRRHERFGEFAKRKESCPTHSVLLTAQAGAGELLLSLVMPRPDSRRFPWAESWGKPIPTGLSACTAGIHTSSASPRTNPARVHHQSFCCLALGLTQAGTEAGIAGSSFAGLHGRAECCVFKIICDIKTQNLPCVL